MFFRAVTTLCLIALPVVFSYSSGAPEGACQSMTPQHGVPPQSSPVPYTLALSSKAIRAGEQVQLEIKGNTPQHTIKGFLVQARVGDQPIGRFQVAANDKFVQVINCGNGQGVSTLVQLNYVASKVIDKFFRSSNEKHQFSRSLTAWNSLYFSLNLEHDCAILFRRFFFVLSVFYNHIFFLVAYFRRALIHVWAD